ncbi:hypothetical protein CpPA04_0083 [Corynebacterium pseudotuberculosis]|nr:hypothetical protein CpPA04_0083 [Corynebacterium pseudotuberculosis]
MAVGCGGLLFAHEPTPKRTTADNATVKSFFMDIPPVHKDL